MASVQPVELRRIEPGSEVYQAAFHQVLGLPPRAARQGPAPQIENLITSAKRGTVSIDLFVGAYQNGDLVSVALVVESPGGAAMVFVVGNRSSERWAQATVVLLQAVQTVAWERSIVLLEILLEPGSEALAGAIGEAGFRKITRLLYLQRHDRTGTPAARTTPELEWVHFSEARQPLFESTLASTYKDSQDCPELAGLRTISDVLAGHRATEVFDPKLWWVALSNGAPVGVILLNRIQAEAALEVDYMGVVPSARGRGVADALLSRAATLAREINANHLTLAVDERNEPARHLYARWGFTDFGVREAWIASPSPTRV